MVNKADILGFAETMNTHQLDLIFEGYEVFSLSGTKFKTKGRASGGFAILILKYLANKIEFLPASSKY